nr:hypothetical transcript [Hymenolepis microstoma]
MMVALVTILFCLFALNDVIALPQDIQTTRWITTDDGTKPFSETVKPVAEFGGNLTKPTTEVSTELSTEEVATGEDVLSANELSTHSAELFSGSSTIESTLNNSETPFVTESTEPLLTQKEGVNEELSSEVKAFETSIVTDRPTSPTPEAMETVETVTVAESTSTETEPLPHDIKKKYETLFDRLREYTRKYYSVDKEIQALMRNRLNEILELYNGVNQDLSKEEFLDK